MSHHINLRLGVFEVKFDETHMQSKAFWKSVKIMPIDFLSSKASLHFSVILRTSNSEDLPFLKPHWELVTRLCWFRKESSWKQAMLSSNLLGIPRSEIGQLFPRSWVLPFLWIQWTCAVFHCYGNMQSSKLFLAILRKVSMKTSTNICSSLLAILSGPQAFPTLM